MRVFGRIVDDQTRCIHYRTPKDVIAVKFKCCGRYYPCHLCHDEAAGHPPQTWQREQWQEPAILCGVCKREMTIRIYLGSTSCPNCNAQLNERCAAHAHLYFDSP